MVKLPADCLQVLAELEMLSHGGTTNYAPSGAAFDASAPPGERGPPHIYWRDEMEAASPERCERLLEQAREELKAWRKRATPPPRIETEHELEARVIREGRGWTVEQIAFHCRCTERFVRRARQRAGVNPVTGEGIVLPDEMDRREKAIKLADKGMTERQIAMITGLSKSTIRRVIGKAA